MARTKTVNKRPEKGSKKNKDDSDNEEYEVEQIIDSKTQKGKTLYYVKWKGYPLSAATWEPAANLSNSKKLIEAYETEKKKAEMEEEEESESGSENEEESGDEEEDEEEEEEEKEEPQPKGKRGPKAKETKKASSIVANSKKIRKQSKSPAGRPKQTRTGKAPKAKASPEKKKRGRPTGSKDSPSKSKGKQDMGSFKTDVATAILDHVMLDEELKVMRDVQGKTSFDKIFFKIDWDERADGSKPTSTFFPFQILKVEAPKILLDYIHKMSCSE